MPSIKQILVSLVLATAVAASQISDGQVQAATSVPAVTQITDGQIQAPTSAAPVKQISDGQIQAPTSVAPVKQISDGQIQAPVTAASTGTVAPTSNGTFTSPAPSAHFTGAAAVMSWSQEIVMAAVGAAAGLAML